MEERVALERRFMAVEMEDLKRELDEVKRVQNLLGDYMDSEFKKVLDSQARVKTLTTISSAATIGLSVIGTVVVAYQYGERSSATPSPVMGRFSTRR